MARPDRSLVSQMVPFKALSAEETDAILARGHCSRFAKNAEIFGQEADADAFFLLLSGYIRVVRTSPEGHQIIARFINEGELFGIAVAMGRSTYPAAAVAAVDCVVVAWPNAFWPTLQARFPAFAASAFQTIGHRLQETQERVVEMSTEQVEQRIAVRCCAWPGSRAVAPMPAWRSTSRSPGRTSPR